MFTLFGSAYTKTVGIHAGTHHVRAVEMVRIGPWVRCTKTWCVPVIEERAAALGQLAGKLRPDFARIAVHLDAAELSVSVRNIESDEFEQSEWRERLVSELVAGGMVQEEFVSTVRLFAAMEDQATVGVAVTTRDALEGGLGPFRTAGMAPSFVGVSVLEVAGAAAFDERFRTSCRHLLIEESGTVWLAEVEEGTIHGVRQLPVTRLEEALGERLLAKGGDSLWVTSDLPALETPLPDQVQVVRPLAGLRNQQPLDPPFAVAAALALRALYVDPEQPDQGSFLDEAEACGMQSLHEERLGKRLTITFGVAAFALLLVLTGLDAFLQGRLTDAEEALRPHTGLIATVEHERQRTDRLRREVIAAEERLGTRTQSAAALSAAAAVSPRGIRWRELHMTIDHDDGPQLVLRGTAREDASLAVFLRAFEEASVTGAVHLVVAEAVSAGRASARDTPSGPAVRRFEVLASVPAAAGGYHADPEQTR